MRSLTQGIPARPNAIFVACLSALLAACTSGIIGNSLGTDGPTGPGSGTGPGPGATSGSGTSSGSGSGSGTSTGSGGGPGTSACEEVAPPTQRLYLLDMQSYVNAITDQLGADAVTDMTRSQVRRSDLFTNGVPTLSDAVERETLAEYASKTLTGPKLDTFAGCSGAAQTDECARASLGAFMKRSFRRATDPTELDALMNGPYKTGRMTSFARAVQIAVEAVLQAASTLYIKEIGSPGTAPNTMDLDPFEIASQLSFFLLDSVPDKPLLDAASAGRLRDPVDIQSQVTRLLAVPAVQERLTSLVLLKYHLDDVLTATAVDGSLADVYTESLRASFYRESHDLIQDVLWKTPRAYTELFTTKLSFINQELATKVYMTPFTGAAGQFVGVTLPENRAAGLLARGSLLAGKSKSNTGSVVKRGKSIRIDYLCLGTVPAPPTDNPDVKKKLEEQVASTLSEGELAAERAANAVCRACHARFDPLGLALNQFDRVGRFVSAAPAHGQLGGVDSDVWSDVEVDGAVDLGQRIASHPGFASCVASSVLRLANREANTTSDCQVRKVGQDFASSGFLVDGLVKAVSASGAFLSRTQGAP